MRWLFGRRAAETRADSSYTDALIASITANAGGKTTAFPTATGALEACAGLVGRAFAAAEVEAPDFARAALSPACLGMIGRALIRRGELVFRIDVRDGALRLDPCQSHDVKGGPDPDLWRYRCVLGGPSETRTYDPVMAEGVVHLAYALDPETPWRGHGPLGIAQLAGRLSAQTIAALADESSMARGAFLPLPVDGNDPTIGALKDDIKNAKGSLLTVESGDFDKASGAVAAWKAERFGPAPPAPLVSLLMEARKEVFAACGVPPTLVEGGQGTAERESFRRFLFATVAPLGRVVAQELSAKLEAEVNLDWTELRASDIAGRARAFQSMTAAGMDLAQAAALSGLMIPDE